MSFAPFSRMNRREVQKVFEAWQARLPAQADAFSQRVWGDGQTCESRGMTIDDLPTAVHFVADNLNLVAETPDGPLPLWLVADGWSTRGFPTAPDLPSAWLLDEYASWNVLLALKLWPESELIMFDSPMRSRDSTHNCWEVSVGSDAIPLALNQLVNMVLTFGWPADQRADDDERVELINGYQRRIFGLARIVHEMPA